MACFEADHVPVGTKLYAAPIPATEPITETPRPAIEGLTLDSVIDLWEQYPGAEFVDQLRAAAKEPK